MALHLPHIDPTPDQRAAQLERARQTYRYSYEWPPEVAVAAEVPKKDTYSPGYIAHLIPVNLKLFENSLKLGRHVVDHDRLAEAVRAEGEAALSMSPAEVGRWFFEAHTRLTEHITSESAGSIDEYEELFAAIDKVPVYDVCEQDEVFAWQRIAGVNPMLLARTDAIPAHIGICEADWRAAIGSGSLAEALAAGRVFALDYALLDGAPGGVTNGRQKYLPAPYALFAAVDGSLRPIAIQVGQRSGDRIVRPDGGMAWTLAKLSVQVADASYHETIAHLGRTHLVMEAVCLATHRQLAEAHPLHRLLIAHTEFTLPINHSAATSLIAPGGTIDKAFGATIEASAGLVRTGLDAWPISGASPPDDLARRGLLDLDVLPEHPYRDDALLVWGAIEAFVSRYVRHHYPSDAEVVADSELAAFVSELGARDGGRLAGVDPVRTVDALVKLIATFVWTATAQHSAVNFPQFPYMGAIPNIAGALWSPWPAEGVADDEATRLAVLPPANMALLQFDTVYQLSNLRVNYLGHYGLTWTLNPEIAWLVEQLHLELKRIEAVITERDASRLLPYPHLVPSTIPNSIHI